MKCDSFQRMKSVIKVGLTVSGKCIFGVSAGRVDAISHKWYINLKKQMGGFETHVNLIFGWHIQ